MRYIDVDASHDIGGDASMDDGVLLPILLSVCWFVFASVEVCFWSLVDVPLVAPLHVISSSHLGINIDLFLRQVRRAKSALFLVEYLILSCLLMPKVLH